AREPLGASRSAKRPVVAPFGARRSGQVRALRLIVKGAREDVGEDFERAEVVAANGSLDRLFDAVVPRDEGGIGLPHRSGARRGRERLGGETRAPRLGPGAKGVRLVEQRNNVGVRGG